MKKISVRTMLGGAFALLVLIALAISAFAVNALADANAHFQKYIEGIVARGRLAAQVRQDIDKRAIAARNLVLVTSPEDREIEKAIVIAAHKDVATHLEKLKELAKDASGNAKRLISEMDRIEQAYGPVAMNIVELALAQKNEEAIAKMNTDCRPLLAALVKVTDEYAQHQVRGAIAQVKEAENAYSEQRNALLLACGLASIFAIVAGTLIARYLIKSLGAEPHELGALANRVADGDLASALALHPGDSTSVVASMARMQSSLRQVLASVRESSEQVSTASTQIAQGNQDLSNRTENHKAIKALIDASVEQSTEVSHVGEAVHPMEKATQQNAARVQEMAAAASSLKSQAYDLVRVVSKFRLEDGHHQPVQYKALSF